MINKLLKQGTLIAMILSCVCFLISLLFNNSELMELLASRVYRVTQIISILFLLTVSDFINQKFNQILKMFGAVFLLMVGINLLSELNIYKVENVVLIGITLFSSIYFYYLFHFTRKSDKNKMDYFKVALVTSILINGFLKQFEFESFVLDHIIKFSYWTLIVGLL